MSDKHHPTAFFEEPSWNSLRHRSLFGDQSDPTEELVRGMLEPVYPLLWQVVMTPWEALCRHRETSTDFHHLSEGQLAWWLHSQIRHQAGVIFEGHEFVSPQTLNSGMFILNVHEGDLLITIKKLKKRALKGKSAELEMSRYETRTSRDYWSQRKMQGYPDGPRVLLGYTFKKEATEIGVMLAYPESSTRRMLWTYDIPDQSAALIRADRHDEVTPHSHKGYRVVPTMPDLKIVDGDGR